MNILVLNGSPAGANSITLQTVEYWKVFYPQHDWEILPVGQRIRSMEKDFSESKAALENADLILFSYPVYTFLVPAQLHRFIELIKENGVNLSGKYAAQLTTSKHFYDVTAHRFIEDNCRDLGLKYLHGFSADMEDILTKKGRREALQFFRFLLWSLDSGFSQMTAPVPAGRYEPLLATPGTPLEKKESFRVALVTDYDPAAPNPSLLAMIRRFENRFPAACEEVNLHEFPFSGGCLGCFHCASDGQCIYKDGFDTYLREHINGADAVVYAYTVRDHSMGSVFKTYDDRQFCNGHRTVTMGKPVGYLVSGNLAAEENLKTLMEARAQVGGNFLAGVATDAANPDEAVDQLIRTLVYALRHGYQEPKNFYGVGGLKIFRDLIYQMQGLMREDHRFYKAHGFYRDFPQKHKGRIAGMYLVGSLMKNRKLQKKMKFSMTDGMMMAYRQVIEKAKKEAGTLTAVKNNQNGEKNHA